MAEARIAAIIYSNHKLHNGGYMSKGKRVAVLAIAILFLVTTVGFSVAVFLEMRQQNDSVTTQSNETTQEPTEQEEQEAMLQGTTLENYEPISEVNELQVIDLKEGEGEVVQEGATVTAHYTGAYANTGEIFQSSKDIGEPISFGLSQVIQGWQEGVPGMKVGGIRRVIIPADKAYGPAPEGYVNGSTDQPLGPLVFDIELFSVEQ